MKNTDVLIIGGSAGGMVTAVTAKAHWPEKSFTLIKKQKHVMVPCGIPYTFGTPPCLTASPAAYPLIKAAEKIAIDMLKR